MVLKPIVIFSFVILQLIYYCASESPPTAMLDGMKIANPKHDFVFKKIFSDHELLLAFINSVLRPETPFQSVQFLQDEHSLNCPYDRTVIIDVICGTGEDEVIVEVQMTEEEEEYFVQRLLNYAIWRDPSQLRKSETSDVEQKTSVEPLQAEKNPHVGISTTAKPLRKTKNHGILCRNLKPVHYISICDFILFDKNTEYISHHRILNNVTYENDVKDFAFTFIELGKLRQKKSFDPESFPSNLEMFCFFFLFEGRNARYMEGLKTMYEKNSLIKKAVEIANSATWSVQEYNEYLEKMIANEKAMVQEGHEKGKIEGEKIGQEKTENNVLRAMISHNPNMTPAELAKFSGIPLSRIETFISKLTTTKPQNS